MGRTDLLKISPAGEENPKEINAILGGPVVRKELPLVIMLHDIPGNLSGTGLILEELQEGLSLYGFDTLRFDFCGWGSSAGDTQNFSLASAHEDVGIVRDWARQNGYDRFFLLSEGYGALPALSCLGDCAAAVMLWPVFRPADTPLKALLPASGAPGPVTWKDHSIDGAYLAELAAFDPAPLLTAVEAPLLIQYGESDTEAPPGQIDEIRLHVKKSPRVEITSYQNGAHGLPLPAHRASVLFHIQQFLKKFS